MRMNAKTKMAAKLDEELSISFDIQVCSNDGRILREYTLTRKDDQVTTLKSAEHHVRVGLSGYKGELLSGKIHAPERPLSRRNKGGL